MKSSEYCTAMLLGLQGTNVLKLEILRIVQGGVGSLGLDLDLGCGRALSRRLSSQGTGALDLRSLCLALDLGSRRVPWIASATSVSGGNMIPFGTRTNPNPTPGASPAMQIIPGSSPDRDALLRIKKILRHFSLALKRVNPSVEGFIIRLGGPQCLGYDRD